VVVQAFVDDSRSETGDREFVLAGYMTTAPEWMKFSDAWQSVLRQSPAIEYLHMTDAQYLVEEFRGWSESARDKKIMRLAEVVNNHAPMMSFETRMSQVSFNRILLPVSPYDLRNPYLTLFHALVVTAARQLHIHDIRVPIDFIFDEQGAIGAEAAMWYPFQKAMLPPELKPMFGAGPIFRDDKQLAPLQAADMLAWHLRRSREERFATENRPALEFLIKDGHMETWVPDESLQSIADQFAKMPGIANVKTKKQSVKPTMMAIESELRKMPAEEQPYEKFDAAMRQILSVSKEELQRRLDEEKAAKTASSRASSGKD
jgi:hypothetical protein